MTTATTAADAIQAAADLAPLIQASAEEADRNHQLSDEVVEGLLDLGIYRYLIPQSLGGLGTHP